MTPPPMPPGYVLIAQSEKDDKDTQIATMKAQIATLEANAKKAQEDKEKLEATLKAMNIFNQGNGVNNVNTIASTQGEPATVIKEQTAIIAKLSGMVTKPIIEQILTARRALGDTEEMIKNEEIRLTAMKFDDVSAEFERNKLFYGQALAANNSDNGFANVEKYMPFNGGNESTFPLTGKAFSIDNALEGVPTI